MSIQILTTARRRGIGSRRSACRPRSSARRSARAPRASHGPIRTPPPRRGRTAGRPPLRERPEPPSPRRSLLASPPHPLRQTDRRRPVSARPRRPHAAPPWPSCRRRARLPPAAAAARFPGSRVRTPAARSADERLHALARERHGLALDVVLVPEGEGEQAPELAREVLLARHMAIEQRRRRLGSEVALATERLRAERLASEGRELTAEPGGGGDREASLLA